MKLIVAMIRPESYPATQRALDELGLCQVTLSDVWGRGHEPGHTMIYRGSAFQDARLRRLKLEIAVDDDAADAAIAAIECSAKTGRVGDGIILVLPIEEFVRVRTGQSFKPSRAGGAKDDRSLLAARRRDSTSAWAASN
jgi:nitrogen regulatory protein PII